MRHALKNGPMERALQGGGSAGPTGILTGLLLVEAGDSVGVLRAALSERQCFDVQSTTADAILQGLLREPWHAAILEDRDDGSGSSTLGALAALRMAQPGAAVIVVTNGSSERREQFRRVGAFAVLPAGLAPDFIVQFVDTAVGHRTLALAARFLGPLQRSSAALLASTSEEEVLQITVQGLHDTGFDRVRLYILSGDRKTMHGRAQVGMDSSFVGAQCRVATDRYMQTLLVDPRPHVFRQTPGQVGPPFDVPGRDVEQWACIPFVHDGVVIGKLSVDNAVTRRPLHEEDLVLVELFASCAAVALEKVRLHTESRQRARRLQAVLGFSATVNSTRDLDSVLVEACRSAVELLKVSHSGLVLFTPDEHGVIRSGVMQAEFPALIGTSLPIPIANVPVEEELIRTRVPRVIEDTATEQDLGPIRDIMLRSGIRSALLVPIVSKERIVGSFSLDSIGEKRRFTSDEIEHCQIFAAQVAAAIEHAELVAKLREEHDLLNEVVQTSPSGIVSLDSAGAVVQINPRATEILGYSEQEARGKAVEELYEDPGESRRVARWLHEHEGRLTNMETTVRSGDGRTIPIRLSAAWRRGNGGIIGSVGHFEDLQPLKLRDDRLRLLLEVSNLFVTAPDLDSALRELARKAISVLTHTLCVVLLADGPERLVIKAAFARDTQCWMPPLDSTIILPTVPSLVAALRHGSCVIERGDPACRGDIDSLSHTFNLAEPINTILCVPLKIDERLVGVLLLAEASYDRRDRFTPDEHSLADALGSQTALLIDRLQLHAQIERQRRLISRLDSRVGALHAEMEVRELLRETLDLGLDLLEGTAGGVLLHHPQSAELEVLRVRGLPGELVGKRLIRGPGALWAAAGSGQPSVESGLVEFPEHPVPVGSIAAAPLKWDARVEYIVFVAARDRRDFASDDLEILARLAARAAKVVQGSMLLSWRKRVSTQITAFRRIIDYIASSTIAARIVHTTLTGVTAGYGLGFNAGAILLVDRARGCLVGAVGIGHGTEAEARADWIRHEDDGREDFSRYIELLEQGALPPTPLNGPICELALPLGAADELGRAVYEGGRGIRRIDDGQQLPPDFVKAFSPHYPLVVVPLIADDSVLGLLVADNRFSRDALVEDERLMTLAGTAAAALAAAATGRFVDESESLRPARLRAGIHDVHLHIVASAQRVLGAEGAVLIPYDQHREQFLTEAGVVIGVPRAVAEALGGHAANAILQRGRLVADLSDAAATAVLGAHACALVSANHGRSVEGLALKVGSACLGVLYVVYGGVRGQTEQSPGMARAVAEMAAAELEIAESREEISRAKLVAEYVARLTALGVQGNIWTSVVTAARTAVDCDVVTLYVHDADVGSLSSPPAHVGLRVPEGVERLNRVEAGSLVWEMLRLKEPYYKLERIADDERFSTSRFARDEDIASCLAIPLTAKTRRVGVMFVNYRRRHRFARDELNTINLIANQAAVAIDNAQQYHHVTEMAHAKEEFLASVSHEMGTPVASVKGFVDILCHERSLPDATRIRYLELLQGEVNHLKRLIEDILDAASMEVRRIDLRLSHLNLNELAARVVQEAEIRRPISFEASAAPLWVRGDGDRLKQVLVNLIDNAIKFSAPGQPIGVAVASEGERAVVRVFDHGPGISEQVEALVFEKFWRLAPPGAHPKGIGLGLYLSREIMFAHNGAVEVERQDGWGAVVAMKLALER